MTPVKPYRALLLLMFLTATLRAEGTANANADAGRHFFENVKPLLETRCISCHGAEKQKGGLRLDSRAAIIQGGATGPSIEPGNPAKSLILQAVMHASPELAMPPKEKLTARDVAVLERWIRDGAPWPDAPTATTQSTRANAAAT